ncbi:matrixin family metalloprotease [Thalassobaculum sp.]|uniref:matrixin family metalloprotease n=1 Tax=Thalassobaculum sp. TaxID=2022740 RepID=UPI0032EC5E80
MAVRTGLGLLAICLTLGAGSVSAADQYEWLRLERHHVKWGAPAAGIGSVVTYALATGSIHFEDARNCRDMQPLDGLRAASGIAANELGGEVRAAFAMWQAVADIRFEPAPDGVAADILIGAQSVPRGVAFADVAYHDGGATDGIRSIRRSLVCLNPEKRWMAGFDGDPETFDLRYALAHEIGHAIGLDHPGPSGQLMSFRYEEAFRDLQPGDVAGAVGLYGRAAPGTATPQGPTAPVSRTGPLAGGCPPGTRETTALTAGGSC